VAVTQDKGHRRSGFGAAGKGFIIVGLAVVAAVVLGMIIKRGRDGAGGSPGRRATFTVARGDLPIMVSESGTLRTADPIKIMAEITGQATIVELVDEGTRVEEGDLLVRLDTSELEQREAQQAIELENAEARLVQAEEDKRIQELNNESELASARLAVENARMELEKYGAVALTAEGFLDEAAYESGTAPPKGEAYQEFRDAELEITRAQTELEDAERDFDGMGELLEKGFVTKNDYINADLNVLEKRRKLESARLKHHLLKTYTYPKQRAQLESDLEKARADLRQAELTTASRLRQKEAAIEQAQRFRDMRKERLEETREQLSKMTVTAPEAGIVIYGDERRWWERDRIKVGGTVSRGTVILTLPRVSQMLAAVDIAEKDIGKIKVGQKAVITMPALPEMTITGSVKKIANVASEQSRWRGSDVKSFEVEIAMDTSDPKMKPGMSAEVEITIDMLEDVLYVPVNAVYKRGEEDVCFVETSGGMSTVPVVLGQSGEIYVEIKEGLTEGQRVVLYEAMPARLQGEDEAAGREEAADEEAAAGETAEAGAPTGDAADEAGGGAASEEGAAEDSQAPRAPASQDSSAQDVPSGEETGAAGEADAAETDSDNQ